MEIQEDRVGFWKNQWERDAFWHLQQVHPFLQKYLQHFIPDGSSPKRIFVPLCGKTTDLKWFHDMGHYVVGLEGVEKIIKEFFQEHGLTYEEQKTADGVQYFQTPDGRLKILCSDLFTTPASSLGKFDCVWDRGSFVAINYEDRKKYAGFIKQLLSDDFRYLLISFVYDPTKFNGPPRNLPLEEVQTLLGDVAQVQVLEEVDAVLNKKLGWNLEFCNEVVLLLTQKN